VASEGWKPLGEGSGVTVVAAVDFEATGRPEACFSDLAPLLDPRREVWTATQPAAGGDITVGAPDYVRHWADGLAASGRPVGAVLGFCAGGVFATALAEEIGRRQGGLPPTVILDPEPPTAATLVKQFEGAMRGLASVASEEELAPAREAVARAEADQDLRSLGRMLGKLYQEVSEPAFLRIGLKADFCADLVTGFESLMSYLVAAADVPLAEGWAASTAILSATPVHEPAGVAHSVRTQVAHADLLRSAEVARLVSEALG
jgi:hypothetical protein